MPLQKKAKPDFVLLIVTFLLLIVGMVMVYSSSAIWAQYKFDDSFYFLKRQLLFAFFGVVFMIVLMNIPYQFWKTKAKFLLFLCFFLLVIVLIPGVGLVRGGARSWLGIGAFSIQPSEFMKLSMIVFLARYLSIHQQTLVSFKKGLLPPLFIVLLAFSMIMLQPDLGTGAVMVITCMVMLYSAGAKVSHFIGLISIGILGLIGLILSAPYRMKRITSFLDPWEDPLGSGFQIIQSLYAIGPGGLLGLGLGQSRQKFHYLPEPQTDFIFAIIAEEMGFIGGGFVLLLFVLMFIRGVRIAILSNDSFGTFLAIGIVSMLAIQVVINIGVVIGLFPVTGITLPLLSYGGSSLTLMLGAIGILLNISQTIKI